MTVTGVLLPSHPEVNGIAAVLMYMLLGLIWGFTNNCPPDVGQQRFHSPKGVSQQVSHAVMAML